MKMSEKEKIRIECLSELLEGYGVSLPDEALARIADDFYHHIQMESEMDSYRHVDRNHEPDFVPADNIQLFHKRQEPVGATHYSEAEYLHSILGHQVYAKVPLYVKNPKRR